MSPAATGFESVNETAAVSICVPTPLGKTKDPDLSSVLAAADGVAASARPGQLIVLESTVYPGTAEEILLPRLRRNEFVIGKDLFVT